jgi:hypothetical protein
MPYSIGRTYPRTQYKTLYPSERKRSDDTETEDTHPSWDGNTSSAVTLRVWRGTSRRG